MILSHGWFSSNNSKTVKARTLTSCSVQKILIRDIRTISSIPNLSKLPVIRQNPRAGVSNFCISGQSLLNENCHNSRTSDDIEMKLGNDK